MVKQEKKSLRTDINVSDSGIAMDEWLDSKWIATNDEC